MSRRPGTFLGTLAAVVTLAGPAGAAPPNVVSWQKAAAHVGRVVSVEGEVAAVRATGDTCVLEFAPDDPQAFRAVLVLAMFSRGPRHPERLYTGRQVRVTGRLQQFQGRPEMVLHGADQIELVGADEATEVHMVLPAGAPARVHFAPGGAV